MTSKRLVISGDSCVGELLPILLQLYDYFKFMDV